PAGTLEEGSGLAHGFRGSAFDFRPLCASHRTVAVAISSIFIDGARGPDRRSAASAASLHAGQLASPCGARRRARAGRGARIRGCPGRRSARPRAKGVESTGGRVTRVVIDNGTVETDAVVIAAGAHSNELSSQLGSKVPLETERGYHVMLESPSITPRIPVMAGEGKYFATPMEGGLRIAGTVELAGLDAPPKFARADALLAGAKRLLPELRHGKVERWMGH